MNKTQHKLTLSSGEHCDLTIHEHNHKVISLHPTLTLTSNVIPPHAFQEITNYVLQLNLPYAKKLYFDNLKCIYKIIQFNLFGHITAALKKELRKPTTPTDHTYTFIEDAFFPELTTHIIEDIDYLVKRVDSLHRAYRWSKVKTYPFCLAKTYDVKYNTEYLLHPKQLLPFVTTRMYCKIRFFDVLPPHIYKELKDILIYKFEKHGVILVFK